jgi:hypothetical protein
MLRDAHRAQEISGEVSLAVKDERWGDATRHLNELQEITSRLLREVGQKSHETLTAPNPDRRDRG